MRSIVSSSEVDRISGTPLRTVNPQAPAAAAPKPDPTPPFLRNRLPAWPTLLYLEKLGLVVLTVAGVVYLLTRVVQGGPLRGLEAAASIRGVKSG